MAEITHVTIEQIETMLKNASQDFIVTKPLELKRLGIDEIAWVKGQENYCAVLIDLDEGNLIAILSKRTQAHIREFLIHWRVSGERVLCPPNSRGTEILEQIEEVSIDLWKPYKTLVEELMPNAQVFADRFHVMKQVNDELDRRGGSAGEDSPAEPPQRKQEKHQAASVTALRAGVGCGVWGVPIDESRGLFKGRLISSGYATREQIFLCLHDGGSGACTKWGVCTQLFPYTPHPTREFGGKNLLSPDTRPHTPFLVKNESEKSEIVSAINNSKYALIKNGEILNEAQLFKLDQVKLASSILGLIHDLKEGVSRMIFEQNNDWLEVLFDLGSWLNLAVKHFQISHGTINRWLAEIIAYFDNRTSSGFVEGINSKLKLITRSAYGFRNFDRRGRGAGSREQGGKVKLLPCRGYKPLDLSMEKKEKFVSRYVVRDTRHHNFKPLLLSTGFPLCPLPLCLLADNFRVRCLLCWRYNY